MAGVVAVVHGFVPVRLTPWADWLRKPLEILVQPMQSPLAKAVGRLRAPAAIPVSDDPRVATLQQERDLYKMYYQQQVDEGARLRRQIEDLQRAPISPDLPVMQIPAPVVGGGTDHSSSVLKVRAGRRKGITPYNAVAVVQGVHLVGKVTASAAPFCDVLPITDRRAATLGGVVMLDGLNRGPKCTLAPLGNGTLRGPVEFPDGTIEPAPIKAAMTVRLMDASWPVHAQMLIIGLVESVETRPNQRSVIVVRPVVRIDGVSEVVLRVLGEAEGEGGERVGGKP